MMASDYIIDVTEADFEYQVLAYSQNVPVVVDFWAEWCGPCRTLGPLLERLAEEAQGAFRLAKVNVDENQNLAMRYAVRSIPFVKAFRHGQMVAEFIGAQPEPKVREFIRSIAPSPGDLALEKGLSLLNMGQPANAEVSFREVLEKSPANPSALLGLAKSLLQQGKHGESHAILVNFPASREFNAAMQLLPLSQALHDFETGLASLSDDPLEAAYDNALRLVKLGNLEAAMDGLLDILRKDKHFHGEIARKVFVSLLELLGENNPVTRQYRAELSSVLF